MRFLSWVVRLSHGDFHFVNVSILKVIATVALAD